MDERGTAISRRGFVAGSLALTTAPAFGVVGRERPALFLCDAGCAAPPDMAGLVLRFDGDITALWRERIDPLWQSGDAVVAGVTRPSVLFCLEELARGRRRRVVERIVAAPGQVRWTIAPVNREGWI